MEATYIHYKTGKDYDIIDVCKDYSLNFNRGNILKYVARAGKKNDELQDLRSIRLLTKRNRLFRE